MCLTQVQHTFLLSIQLSHRTAHLVTIGDVLIMWRVGWWEEERKKVFIDYVNRKPLENFVFIFFVKKLFDRLIPQNVGISCLNSFTVEKQRKNWLLSPCFFCNKFSHLVIFSFFSLLLEKKKLARKFLKGDRKTVKEDKKPKSDWMSRRKIVAVLFFFIFFISSSSHCRRVSFLFIFLALLFW